MGISIRTSLYLLFTALSAFSQVTLADYRRAIGLQKEYHAAATTIPFSSTWVDATRFWYNRAVPGGHEFVLTDAPTRTKRPAFDHVKLAESLSKATGVLRSAIQLPFGTFRFVDKEQALEFAADGSRWKCALSDYACTKVRPDAVPSRAPVASPDRKWEALVRNYNIYVRPKAVGEPKPPRDPNDLSRLAPDPGFALSSDGSEGNAYDASTIVWSPDSKKLAAYRVRPGYHRKVSYVESSPAGQLQPRFTSIDYPKPGDSLDLPLPTLFLVEERKEVGVESYLFSNPYRMSPPIWRKDNRAFTFEYNQRGHQVYRIIEVDAITGRARAVVDEQAATFFCYYGKKFRHDIDDGREVVWMSERDGWNHLYLYDGVSGKVRNQITRGNWVVRGVDWVDEKNRQVYFSASGMYPGMDPYFVNHYRIGLDGKNLIRLTRGDGNHDVVYSPDHKQFVDTWSRANLAPVSELHATADPEESVEIERGDLEPLRRTGWRPPEVFTALGRDRATEIWGLIFKPRDFDPSHKYPVIEYIYAGPHSSFVPKSFQIYNQMQAMAELGLIVVQMDGMGTSNRSKAFHDVCWKNIADAGFPDRILWHKAVAAKYPWYDISRVGIYGTSAGGQSTLGGLLFHPEFYKVGVASAGCHDNRMDKISWNEQWMGWPVGPEYAQSSNMENAWRLQGKLLLLVGEMDTNVDPSSTLQVVNALIKANKTFDLLLIPGANHTDGGAYGARKRYDFFLHHLLGVEPPDWNQNPKLASLMDDVGSYETGEDLERAVASESPAQ
jgi:hypothetical protein